jgi:hypothetical protein
MSSESVCQVARSWVDVGSFHTRLVVRFFIFTASVRNILDIPSYNVDVLSLDWQSELLHATRRTQFAESDLTV